ncbi:hypothetical protein pb186bvf_002098 [Paramecium bursaria]
MNQLMILIYQKRAFHIFQSCQNANKGFCIFLTFTYPLIYLVVICNQN